MLIRNAAHDTIGQQTIVRSVPMRVAFLGQPGSNSEEAAFRYFGAELEGVSCDSFVALFESVVGERADRALLPIENSLAGSLYSNYDLLLRYNLHIVGEYNLRVRHSLMVLPGVELGNIRRVLSHPSALDQCEAYLRKLNVVSEAVSDTTLGARRIVAENLHDTAAIASRRAAELYGLNILDQEIEDSAENYTRFLVLAREAQLPAPGVPAKTSLVFSIGHTPGALFSALEIFARRNINLTKMESRPLRERRWEYFFYLDFGMSMADDPSREALAELAQIAPFLRVLGSYPAHVE